ncbi:hypothetical protein ACVC7V_13035 [Hydrogenophaga sp. A37]
MNDSQTKSAGKKPKLVRDSFTIPKAEYAAIDALKGRALTLGVSVKKSELLRAGLMLLQQLSDGRFKAAMAAVPTIKTGRPATSIQVSIPFAPTVFKKPPTKPAPVKAVVKKVAPKRVAIKAAPKTIAVKARPTPQPVVQAPAPKPAALPPAPPAAKVVVQPAKKVVAKKAAVTKA